MEAPRTRSRTRAGNATSFGLMNTSPHVKLSIVSEDAHVLVSALEARPTLGVVCQRFCDVLGLLQ